MCETATSRSHTITARWRRQRNEAQIKKAPSDAVNTGNNKERGSRSS